jgi:hypothetical protein
VGEILNIINGRPSLGPVIIGGVGGSGTRLLAQIVQSAGVFIGDDLNKALDNLAFTLLFKRRKWFYAHHNDYAKIGVGLGVMNKLRDKKRSYTFNEHLFLLYATIYTAIRGHNYRRDGKGLWAFQRCLKLYQSGHNDSRSFLGWGWKEPNSYLLLEPMGIYFPEMKYVHCIRHGLDMAYSNNQQQLFNWGGLFGVDTELISENIHEASFRYWKAANQEVLKLGDKLGADKFLLVNFDRLCQDPRTELLRILDFLGLDPGSREFDAMVKLPKSPSSTGRYKTEKNDWITSSDREFLEKLGFEATH